MDCDLYRGTCRRCGRANPTSQPDAVVFMTCRAAPCAHLGDAVRPIKAECQTCNGEKLVEVAAAKCDVFTRCLPTYAPADPVAWQAREESAVYHLCRGCERFTPAPPAE